MIFQFIISAKKLLCSSQLTVITIKLMVLNFLYSPIIFNIILISDLISFVSENIWQIARMYVAIKCYGYI